MKDLFFILRWDCWGGRVEEGEVFVKRGNLRSQILPSDVIHNSLSPVASQTHGSARRPEIRPELPFSD